MFKKLLWIGDAGCSSGFGRCTTEILQTVAHQLDTVVLAVNFTGDPHPLQTLARLYPAAAGRHPLGFNRVRYVVHREQPDLVVLQTNPWNVPEYLAKLNDAKWKVPTIGIVAVEGRNCVGRQLNDLDKVVFWTQFGADEAVAGGLTASYHVIPLGVDLEKFYPGDRLEARKKLGLPEKCWDSFIVTNVNRNQHRKRLDLTLIAFARWVKLHRIENAYVYLHALPGSTVALDTESLASYLGIADRLILSEPVDIFQGEPDEYVRATYQAADVGLSTALGEGWGLTTMEGMACAVPQIVTDYAAIPEWAEGDVLKIPTVSEGVMPDVHGMLGGTPDVDAIVNALEHCYEFPDYRHALGDAGLRRVKDARFRWSNIGQRYMDAIKQLAVEYGHKVE